jgi:hypothetical protein
MKACWVLLAAAASIGTAQAQSEPWDRLEQAGAIYAGTIDDRKNSLEIFCPVTGNPTLELRSPQFRVSVPDGHRYTLTIVTASGRLELVATAKDADLLYEAADLNAKVTLGRVVEAIGASQDFTVAVSSLGWQKVFTAEGAAAALKGLPDRC